MVDKELKIWAAGCFDGEGSALIEQIEYKTKHGVGRTYQITVCVASTDARISTPFLNNWGGHYRKSRNMSKYNENAKGLDCTVLFNREESIRLLADIYLYLKAKQGDAKIMLRALLALPKGGHYNRGGSKRLPRGTLVLLKPFYEELQALRGTR